METKKKRHSFEDYYREIIKSGNADPRLEKMLGIEGEETTQEQTDEIKLLLDELPYTSSEHLTTQEVDLLDLSSEIGEMSPENNSFARLGISIAKLEEEVKEIQKIEAGDKRLPAGIEDIVEKENLGTLIACGEEACYVDPYVEFLPDNVPDDYILCLTVDPAKSLFIESITGAETYEITEDNLDNYEFMEKEYAQEALQQLLNKYDYIFYTKRMYPIKEAEWMNDIDKLGIEEGNTDDFFPIIQNIIKQQGYEFADSDEWKKFKDNLKEKGATLLVEAMDATERAFEALPIHEIPLDGLDIHEGQYLRDDKGTIHLIDFII